MNKMLVRRVPSRHDQIQRGVARISAAVLGLLLLGSVLAQSSGPVRGGHLRMSSHFAHNSMDTQVASVEGLVGLNVYETLVRSHFDPESAQVVFEPQLAASWELEDGGAAAVFQLREQVLFHDGTSWDASTAKWNFDRLMTDPSVRFRDQLLALVDSTEIVGEHAIRVNFHEDVTLRQFLYLMSSYFQNVMVCPQTFEALGAEAFSMVGCGTGPFTVEDWVPDEHVTLTRFDHYWRLGEDGQPLPYLDAITQYDRPDVNIAVLQLRAGALDYVFQPDLRDFATIERDPDVEWHDFAGSDIQPMTIPLNSRSGAFANPVLREAAMLATDRERMAAYFGYGAGKGVTYQLMDEDSIGWAPEQWADHAYDPERARELIESVGGATVTLALIAREPDLTAAQLVKSMWDSVGLNTQIEALDRLTWIDRIQSDQFEAAWHGTTMLPIPEAVWERTVGTGAPGNWGAYSNPQIDRLIVEAWSIEDDQRRAETFSEMARLLYADFAIVPGYKIPLSYTVRAGVHLGPMSANHVGRYYFADTWIDQR